MRDVGAVPARARRLRPPLELALLGLAPCLFFVEMLVLAFSRDNVATDFRHAFRPAAAAVLAGESPYPAPGDPAVAAGVAYVYPPLAAFVAAPATLFSPAVADVLATLLLVALVPAVMYVAGVRDWRCYGAAFLWAPVFAAVQAANVTLLLALALAVAWRFRGRALVAGVACGVAVATKLFLWPVVVWLLLVRGRRAAGAAVAAAAVATLGPWAAIGFAGLREYPALLRRLADLSEAESYTLFAAALDAGASPGLARAATFAVGGVVLVAAVAVARRGDAARSLALFVAAALSLSPIVWLHYYALLLVPIAVLRPRLTPLWLAPALLWTVSGAGNGAAWQTLLTLAVFGGTTFALVRGAPRRPAGAGAPSALPARSAAG